MARRTRYWIILTGVHFSNIWFERDQRPFEYTIAPENTIKKREIVYLWWNPHNLFYGWGEVASTPRPIIETIHQGTRYEKKRKRLAVPIYNIQNLQPHLTADMMRADRHLRNLIPTDYDDLYAIGITKVQANYLDDYIREHKLEAPESAIKLTGSATTRWLVAENAPTITIQALLSFGDKTKEGLIVEGVRIAWFELCRLFANNPEEIFKIDPWKLEELIAGAYEREGYIPILTPRAVFGCI
jgi:hypothetical protein